MFVLHIHFNDWRIKSSKNEHKCDKKAFFSYLENFKLFHWKLQIESSLKVTQISKAMKTHFIYELFDSSIVFHIWKWLLLKRINFLMLCFGSPFALTSNCSLIFLPRSLARSLDCVWLSKVDNICVEWYEIQWIILWL